MIKYRDLDITLVSADDLKNINTFGKMSVYALAYILGHPKTKEKTVVDKNCGTRPIWNHKMSFPIEERTLMIPGLTLLVQIRANKFSWNNNVLGEVYVLIPELFQRAGIVRNEKQNEERPIDFQVTTLSGRGKGTLKIAFAFQGQLSYDIDMSKKTNQPIPILAYPPARDGNGEVHRIPGDGGYGMGAPQGYTIYYHQGYRGGYYIFPPQPHSHPPGFGNYLPLGMYPQPVHGAGLHGGMLIGNMMLHVGEMATFTEGDSNSRQVASIQRQQINKENCPYVDGN